MLPPLPARRAGVLHHRRCQPGEQACCISDTDNLRSRQNLKVAIPVLPDFKTNLFIQKFVNLTYP